MDPRPPQPDPTEAIAKTPKGWDSLQHWQEGLFRRIATDRNGDQVVFFLERGGDLKWSVCAQDYKEAGPRYFARNTTKKACLTQADIAADFTYGGGWTADNPPPLRKG